MPRSCRWCSRPASRTIFVDAPAGVPARMALCDSHLLAVHQARDAGTVTPAQQRLAAEGRAWERLFGEPAPFGGVSD